MRAAQDSLDPRRPPRHRTGARSDGRGSRCGSGTRSRPWSGARAPRIGGSHRCELGTGVAAHPVRLSRPGSEHRERQQGRPPFGLPRQAGRASAGRRSPSSRPSPTASRSSIASSPDRARAASPRRATGRTGGEPCASRDRHLRLVGHVLDELREDVEARPRGDPVRVVDGDPEGASGARHPCQQSTDNGPVGRPRRDRGEELRTERLDPVDRRREVGEEHDRVVVALVSRQPGDRPGVLRRPLDEEARLAVAGRCHDRDEGSIRGDRSWRSSLVRRRVPTGGVGTKNLASSGPTRVPAPPPREGVPPGLPHGRSKVEFASSPQARGRSPRQAFVESAA